MPVLEKELPSKRPMLKPSDIARRARVSTRTIDSLVLAGALPQPVIRVGRITRFDADQVEAALQGVAK